MDWKTYFQGVGIIAAMKLCDAAKSIPLMGNKIAAPFNTISTIAYYTFMAKRRPHDRRQGGEKATK